MPVKTTEDKLKDLEQRVKGDLEKRVKALEAEVKRLGKQTGAKTTRARGTSNSPTR
jgi:hypothetical protein